MPHFDLDLDALREYRPALSVPSDLDAFWQSTLADSRSKAEPPELTPVDAHLPLLDVFDVRFSGFDGERIAAWLLRPRAATGPLPAVVTYRGYGGGRGRPVEHVAWAAAGYAHLVMDTRGQGSGWSAGTTPDPHGSGPAYPGVMTRGIESPHTYYYRRVITDAALAVDAAAALPGIDRDRIAVAGESQGGGVALAAAAVGRPVAAALIDVPFLCHIARAITIAPHAPYTELVAYLSAHHDAEERVLRTLSYVDGAVLAEKVTAPTLFSVALMDEVCPPSTVFAAYNRLASTDRDIRVYPYNGHEGGRPDQWELQAAFLSARI